MTSATEPESVMQDVHDEALADWLDQRDLLDPVDEPQPIEEREEHARARKWGRS